MRAVLNAKPSNGHAGMSLGGLLHFNAALQQYFDFSISVAFKHPLRGEWFQAVEEDILAIV